MREIHRQQLEEILDGIDLFDLDHIQSLITKKREGFTNAKIDTCITELFGCLNELKDLGVRMRIDPTVYLSWDSDKDYNKDITVEYLTEDRLLLIR